MKPYFTKYLPVEGEIKVGDTVFSWHNSTLFIIGKVIRIDEKEVETEDDGGFTTYSVIQLNLNIHKTKLFLCSRDIQVGDEFWMDEQHGPYIASENYISHPLNYKKIGEISPAAIWVKESMEFDEDELIWQARNNEGDVEDHEDWGTKTVLKDDYGYYTVGIKCPTCKNFH